MHKIKIIALPCEYKKEIADLCNVTVTSVRNALCYRTFGGQAERIRQMALSKYGGKETYKWV